MSNQPNTAITPYNRLKSLISSEDVQARFAAILDKRGPGFLASLLSVVSGSSSLQECEPASILTSAAKAAVLDLPIESSLGFAHIVPFKGKATFVMGYKGYIQLAMRTGMYEALNAAEIYQGEQVKEDRLTGKVTLNGQRTGDEITGYVSYFKLKNGFEKFAYMSVKEVTDHAKRYSKSFGDARSAWSTNFPDMAKKTLLRRLLGKYGLLSIEYLNADDDTQGVVSDMADDPRFAMPNFDDVIDGAAQDVTDDPTVLTPDELMQATVAAGKFENIHEARAAFKRCKVEWDTFEKATAWATAYRQWRDLDAKPEKAAEYANSGELPH